MSTQQAEAIRILTPKNEHGIGRDRKRRGERRDRRGDGARRGRLAGRSWIFSRSRPHAQGLAAQFPPRPPRYPPRLVTPEPSRLSFHKHQTDLWVPAKCSRSRWWTFVRNRPRSDSRILYTPAREPWQILIPPGVGHGYKVIGEAPAMLVYVTNQLYNPKDEGRIPYNDPSIHYDWELQHK